MCGYVLLRNDDDETARRRSRESTRKHDDELVFGISGSKKHRKPNNDQNAKSQIPNRRIHGWSKTLCRMRGDT